MIFKIKEAEIGYGLPKLKSRGWKICKNVKLAKKLHKNERIGDFFWMS